MPGTKNSKYMRKGGKIKSSKYKKKGGSKKRTMRRKTKKK
tara:strand:- start:302 stop:421 length:120 start_codon:yes stop_codon:yes gene_type:complete